MDATNNQGAAWWRWPLMPLAAITGAVFGTLALGTLMWLGTKFQGGYNENGWYYKYIMPFFTSACFGYIYAKISYHMAPSGKLIAGTVMVTLFGVFCVFTTVLAWMPMTSTSTGEAIRVTISSAAAFGAAVATLRNPYE